MQPRRYPELDGKTFLICVGAMKAATSWVYTQLSMVPRVAVSPLKEVQFFNGKYPQNSIIDANLLAMKRLAYHANQPGNPIENLRSRSTFQASVDRARMIYDDNAYFEHFARLVEEDTAVFTDITPAYAAIGEDGFRFMRGLCDGQNIKTNILYILRDPVDRLWSHLHFLRQFNPALDPLQNWQEAIRDQATLARCDYKGTLGAIEETFGRENVIALFYETLFDRGFADLCAKLNLSSPEINANKRENVTADKNELPEAIGRALRSALDAQYEFCESRFGSDLPDAWQPYS